MTIKSSYYSQRVKLQHFLNDKNIPPTFLTTKHDDSNTGSQTYLDYD